jgi:large subunit ribosomal protein L24
VRRLEFRAPGATRVSLSGAAAAGAPPDGFKAALNAESADPDVLTSWLQGRSDIAARSQKPFRLRGDVTVAPGGFAIDAMKAEIDGGALEGRVAVFHRGASGGPRVDAELKAERLDLDAATAFVRSMAGPQAEWPDQVSLSLDIGRAIAAGQELRPLVTRLGYDPKSFSLERLKIGQPDNVTIEGSGNFDRVNATGKLALNSSAASLNRLTGLIAPFAPSVAARLGALGTNAAPARAKLTLDLGKGQADRASARAVLDLDAREVKGTATLTAKPQVNALRGIDIDALSRSEVGIEAKFSSEQGTALLALLGLDRAIAAGDGPAQVEGSVNGAWRAPLRLKARLWGAGLDADADGSVEPWTTDSKASVNLRVRSADISPLLDRRPPDAPPENLRLSSRVALSGSRLSFDDVDSIIGGSRLRGHVALTLGEEKAIEGEVGLDQITLAPIFAAAIGAADHEETQPLGAGLVKGWRGKLVFQALHGVLPGGAELQPVSGTVKADGQSVTFDAIKGKIGGGEVTATIDARPGANGIVVNAAVQLNGADGAALRYRNLAMPAGRASMQMTLQSQGRSAAALTGSLSGSGTVTLEAVKIDGLNPRAFEVAIRASDSGQATDDAKLKQFVEPVLKAGALSIPAAQIPFNIRDGRIRVGATTLSGNGANAIVSGGYDIPADQADIRVAVASTAVSTISRPEIQLFSVGTPDALNRTVDVTALSSWLAVRAIDRETRRLDAIERGEPPPRTPAAIPLPAEGAPEGPDAATATTPATLPPPGRDPRRPPQQPRVSAPRPPLAPLTPPAAIPPAPSPPATVANQPQVAPLPPPIEITPVPGAPKPRLAPPLALTPQVANPPPRPPLQNSN